MRYPVPYLLIAAAILAPAVRAQMPPVAVRAAKAELREVQPHRRVTGSLRALARGKVAALEEGRVLDVTVREGARVRRGDIIAKVDARRLQAQKAELLAARRTIEAQIEQRKAELVQARRDLARTQRLLDTRAVTVEEHQHQETQVAVAEAMLLTEQSRLVETESQLELLEVRLEDMVVRAPYDGQVVERHTEPGEWIKAGEPFITLVSTGQIEAWLDVPERYTESLTAASSVALTLDGPVMVEVGGRQGKYEAKQAKRIPDINARTRTFAIVLTLDDPSGVLTPGMSVDAWLPVGDRETRLTVPKDAVIRSGHRTVVYKAMSQPEGMTAVELPVEVLFETGGRAIVQADSLAEGDQVIVEGNERLFPGTAITVATAEPTLKAGEEIATSKP